MTAPGTVTVPCGHCDGTGRCRLARCAVCGPLAGRPARHCARCHATGRRTVPVAEAAPLAEAAPVQGGLW